MELSVIAYLALLLLVGLLRIVELQISRRHQREMVEHGAEKSKDLDISQGLPFFLNSDWTSRLVMSRPTA